MSKVERNMGKGVFHLDQNVSEETSGLEESISAEVRKIGIEELREYGGLCSTCVNASACGYRRAPLKAVWDCCDFEPETAPVNTLSPTVSPLKSFAEDKNPGGYAGLCVNCEHRETCTYTRPEGGVWHCGDYE